jgi:uncharacterized protein YecE (DUF72 family)
MDFGLVDHTKLDAIDFSLPPEPAWNNAILPGKPAKDPKVYIGLPRWGRKEWVGQLYPLRTKESDYLRYYAAHFNLIELNATHHNFYGEHRLSVWSDMAGGKEFKFLPKMIKDVSHAPPLTARDLVLE